MVKSGMYSLDVSGWRDDLCVRIAARHDLSFWCKDHPTPEITILESGFRNPREVRDPTFPELEMWRVIVPEKERNIISEIDNFDERPFLEAIPDEIISASRLGSQLYLGSRDFVILRRMEGFEVSVSRDDLNNNKYGVFRDTVINVFRDIPHGYFISVENKITSLYRDTQHNVREIVTVDHDSEIELEMLLHHFKITK